MSHQEEERNFLMGKTDCAIIIKEDLEINMVMPNLEKIETPSEGLGQAMFLTSYLSYALNRNDWVEEFGKLFESQDPSVLAAMMEGFERGVEEYDAVEEDDSEENEIKFDTSSEEVKNKKPKIVT